LLDASKYEVLSFDCYGTLVDWESGIIAGLRPVLRGHRVEATDDEILGLHAQTEHKLQAASKGAATSSTGTCSAKRSARRAGGGASRPAVPTCGRSRTR
jgi:hypothetical protein